MVTDLFYAKDVEGNVYRVVVTQETVYPCPYTERRKRLGPEQIKLIDGTLVKRVNDTTFEIVQSCTRIVRI